NHITSPLNTKIGLLTQLSYFSISTNSIFDALPDNFLVNKTALAHLDLSNNFMNGSLPLTGISSSNNNYSLTYFNISSNYFYGSLPEAFCEVYTNLTALDISYNVYTNSIPDNINNLQKLTYLTIYNNF